MKLTYSDVQLCDVTSSDVNYLVLTPTFNIRSIKNVLDVSKNKLLPNNVYIIILS